MEARGASLAVAAARRAAARVRWSPALRCSGEVALGKTVAGEESVLPPTVIYFSGPCKNCPNPVDMEEMARNMQVPAIFFTGRMILQVPVRNALPDDPLYGTSKPARVTHV